MTARTNVQPKIKWGLRWGALLVPLVLCGLLLTATTSSQQEGDSMRRSWDKQFEEARAKARGQKVAPKISPTGTRPQTATQSKPTPGATKPAAPPAETVDDELIGITFWRLRPATSDSSGQPRLSVEQRGVGIKSYRLERADTETPFREGEMVRFGVETTRADNRYLYVIDREVYADKTMGEPYLIFPVRTTPPGGNVIAAGRLVYVPAQGDPLPYLTLQRKRPDHVGERLTIILSPEPLPLGELTLNGAPLKLDAAVVKQWEQQWGGPTERREVHGRADMEWTKAEQAAEREKGMLAQGDAMPQMIYRVASNRSGKILVVVPLKIAPANKDIPPEQELRFDAKQDLFTPPTQYLATGYTQFGQPRLVVQYGDMGVVCSVAFSPNGQSILTGGDDKITPGQTHYRSLQALTLRGAEGTNIVEIKKGNLHDADPIRQAFILGILWRLARDTN